MDMRSILLSPHFTLEEFTASDLAARKAIDNHLPQALMASASSTARMLERVRDKLSEIKGQEVPVFITSGYRCHELNELIGSKETSHHRLALAADIKAPTFGTAKEVAKALVPFVNAIGIGQLILEFNSWVHVSAWPVDNANNRILTIDHDGVKMGI